MNKLTSFELISIEYSPTLQHYYDNFAVLPGFVLLESADRTYGRYDILSAFPYDRIIINADQDDWSYPLSKLDILFKETDNSFDLPFQGGAIGYISYDFGARLHGVYSEAQPALMDMPLLDLGLYDWAIVVFCKLR